VAPGAIETGGWKVYTPEARAVIALEYDDARRLAGGYCARLSLPRRASGGLHRRNVDGGRRRSALGRDLDHGYKPEYFRDGDG